MNRASATSTSQKLLGLIGYPLGHSFSPAFFAEKFKREQLTNWTYQAFPLSHISELLRLIFEHQNLLGFNVTVPYKHAVLPYLNHIEQSAGQLQAVNCVAKKNGTWWGYNTDVVGFRNALKPLLRPLHRRAIVLGNGGASQAVQFVLKELGIDYQVVSRSAQKGQLLYRNLDESLMSQTQIIINATPLGMWPDVEKCPPIPYQYLTSSHLLFDLIYNPERSTFLAKGETQGAAVSNGYKMLIEQAEASWQIWKNL